MSEDKVDRQVSLGVSKKWIWTNGREYCENYLVLFLNKSTSFYSKQYKNNF